MKNLPIGSFSPEIYLPEEQEQTVWKMLLESEVLRTIEAAQEFGEMKVNKISMFDAQNWEPMKTDIFRDDQKVARAATACADVAKNIVVIASVDQNILDNNAVNSGVSALKSIAQHLQPTADCAISPLNDNIKQWVQLAENGLRNALKSTVYHPTYQDGYLINKEQYIHSKFTDIQIGINIKKSQFHQGI